MGNSETTKLPSFQGQSECFFFSIKLLCLLIHTCNFYELYTRRVQQFSLLFRYTDEGANSKWHPGLTHICKIQSSTYRGHSAYRGKLEPLLSFWSCIPTRHITHEGLSSSLVLWQKGRERFQTGPFCPKWPQLPNFQVRKAMGHLTQQNPNRDPRGKGSSMTIRASHRPSFSRAHGGVSVHLGQGENCKTKHN